MSTRCIWYQQAVDWMASCSQSYPSAFSAEQDWTYNLQNWLLLSYLGWSFPQTMSKLAVSSAFKMYWAGCRTSLPTYRPGLQDHEQKRAHSRRAELAAQARALLKRMSFDISHGLQYLTAAKQHTGSFTSSADLDPGDGRKAKSPSKRYIESCCFH